MCAVERKEGLYILILKSKKLNYLLQSYKIPDLKSICKHYEIKGYSSMKKQELINFIVDSLSEEEQHEFIAKNELEIIDKEFNLALKIIRRSTPEKLISLKVVNQKLGELEVSFQGREWQQAQDAVVKEYGFEEVRTKKKNGVVIAATLEELNKNGKQSPVLIDLCGRISQYAQRVGIGIAT